jgi:nitroimidazol reductase NimA-like FMN-containing flavoprotein (pyridoxamine 5'-phosphate oxidase superfamily)
MSEDGTEEIQGVAMTDTEIDGFLYECGHGLLSLAKDDDAYAIPVSFGYDGDAIFLYLIRFGEQSKKLQFSADTGTACLTAYDVRDRGDWECLVVSGTLDPVPEADADYMDDVMEDNAWFPSFHPPDWPITGVVRMTLSPESLTGRKGGGTARR